MQTYFSSNLKKLAQQYSQKQIAEDTLMSPASITNYINQTSEPSMYFLMQLKKVYNINIDDFLFKDLNPNSGKDVTERNHQRFGGNYLIYYYDSSPYKGSSNLYTKNAINYGIISITEDGKLLGQNNLAAYGQFLLNRKEAEETLALLNKFTTAKDIKAYYENLSDKYVGNISLTNSHIFLSLKNQEHEDEVFMILNSPPSGKTYIGGIATVNSISRGREHMPCIQYSILSRYVLKITDGELYNLLTLHVPDINIDLDVEQLIKLFKSLFLNNTDTTMNLTEYQKKRIVEESLKNTLAELMESNIFRFAKISEMEDDKYYRIIKEEMLNE